MTGGLMVPKSDYKRTVSTKRFVVLGSPNGSLTCLAAGDSRLVNPREYMSRWQRLFVVNRPLTLESSRVAKDTALRCFRLS